MKNANRARLRIVGAKGIGTDKLGEIAALMHGRRFDWPHLMQDDGHVLLRDLPGGFRAGETGADDVDGAKRLI
jgi:hypothetical protein